MSSFAPFRALPPQYRISVEGKQAWFGERAFESLAVFWLFSGEFITIEAPCLDCGERMRVAVRVVLRDGKIESSEPEGMFGYSDIPRNP